MKKGIHPVYRKVTVHCGCGNEFETRSTYTPEVGGRYHNAKDDVTMPVETCSQCNPVYAALRGQKGETRVGVESAAAKFEKKYRWGERFAALQEKLAQEEAEREKRRRAQGSGYYG